MKRISLFLCFALLIIAMLAISAFAATSANVVKDATLVEDGGCGSASAEMIRDGNVNTAASCGSKAQWVNFHFLYKDGISVSKVVVVVNSTGTVYYDNEGAASSIKEYSELSALPNIYLRLYVGETIVYQLNGATTTVSADDKDASNDNVTAIVTEKDGYTLITYEFTQPYSDITKVEVATVHGASKEAGIWEVEIYNYTCTDDSEHSFDDATCAAPATCTHCGATTGDKSSEHTGTWSEATCAAPSTCSVCGATTGDKSSEHTGTWSEATCTTPSTCSVCGATQGEVSTEHAWVEATCLAPKTCSVCGKTEGEVSTEHVWKNASYTAPKTCKVCGKTEGDVWVDSTLPNFVRGDEGDQITYEDIVGEVTLTEGSTSGNNSSPEEVLDGSVAADSFWGGPTNSSIKITLKNEWEITDAKLLLFANWVSLKVGFYAADGTLLGEKNIGGLQANYDYFDGKVQANPTYTDYSAAISGLAYGDNDKAVKYILITNTADKWGWVPGVVECYFTGRERIPTACENHEFEEKIVVAPTCTEAGSKQNVCTICGASEGLVSISALDHDFSEYRIKTPATCISAAVIEFECTRCGETIERATHVDDVTDYIDLNSVVTNGAGGLTSSHYAMFDNNKGTYLMASGQWYVQSEVALDMNYYISSVTIWTRNLQYYSTSSHSAWMIFYYKAPGSDEWVEGGKIATPTRNSDIEYEYTLELAEPVYASAIKIFVGAEDGKPHGGGPGLNSYNGGVLEAKVAGSLFADTAAAGHKWVASGDAVAPKCEDIGYTPYTCSVCDATKKDDFVRETGHSWVNATCTVPKTCSACLVTSGEALGHDMSVAATCTTPLSCSRCDYTEGEALGHTWTNATCTVPKTCSVCSATEGEALGHSYVNPCDKVCEVCYEITNPDATHNIVHVEAKAGTDCQTWDGNVEYWYCSDCGATWADEALTQVTNHMSIVTNGEHSYFYPCDKVCMVCGEVTNPDATHNIVHVEAKAGTDCQTWDGNIEYWGCSDCGAAWADEALTQVTNRMNIVTNGEHNYVAGEPAEDGSVTYTCDNCGDSYTETVEHTHTEVEIPAVLPLPSNNHTGMTAGVKCSECGEVLVAPVEKVAGTSSDKNFKVNSAAMSFGEEITFIYNATHPANSDKDSMYMVFVFNGEEFYSVRGDVVSGNRYRFDFVGQKAHLLAENIEAYVYAIEDGEYVMNSHLQYSGKQYCVNQLKKSSDENFKALLCSVLNLCATTQLSVNPNTPVEELVTTMVENELGIDIPEVNVESIDSSYNVQGMSGDRTQGYDWKSGALALGGSVELKLQFVAEEVEGLVLHFDINGERTIEIDASDLTLGNDGRYSVYFQVKVLEYDKPITCTFIKDGEQVGSTLTYSVYSYIVRQYANANAAESTKNFVKAIYAYSEALKVAVFK